MLSALLDFMIQRAREISQEACINEYINSNRKVMFGQVMSVVLSFLGISAFAKDKEGKSFHAFHAKGATEE